MSRCWPGRKRWRRMFWAEEVSSGYPTWTPLWLGSYPWGFNFLQGVHHIRELSYWKPVFLKCSYVVTGKFREAVNSQITQHLQVILRRMSLESQGLFFYFLLLFLNWSIIDLQCCVNFCCSAVIQLCMHMYFFIFFSIKVYHRILI